MRCDVVTSLTFVQIMVTNVKSLLETVKTVEDEAQRGTRALESSIEVIGQELRVSFRCCIHVFHLVR